MGEKITTAYLTKYALTRGIVKITGVLEKNIGYANMSIDTGRRQHGFLTDRDFSLSAGEAIERAESMRLRKIASLKKQILKLEKTRFTCE